MPDLPTGTVTFLFTDIEGSTRLLRRLGPRFREVKDRHDAIVRAAVTEGGGQVVSTEGDSFFAVFPGPTGALSAAIRAQRDLATELWPDGTALRARMGLHTGEGVLGGDNYLGLDVNRAARIAAAGHGGQVLVSDATRRLVVGELPPDTRIQDLGLHRLKDLAEPEHLFGVIATGLEQEFPPLTTLDARPNNLPAQLTRFIGRSGEIAAVRDGLARHRLLTLSGPGGTGKTRLALQVAVEELGAFRDGVFFVDLSAVADPELVAQEIAAALRVRDEPGKPMVDTLGNRLKAKEMLLVLDNFEQVLDAGATVLGPLLRSARGLKALVTSRIPLHLHGEREYPVPPLALPDPDRPFELETLVQVEAIALFAERAAAGNPAFRITRGNAGAVARITARLDGLPLAIELAASRVKLLSPEQLLVRLEQRLPMLTAQDSNLPERQQTLRRTIEWSYELLDQPERRMFTRLSVFAGGAELDAVDAVANPEQELTSDTLDGLASLVDKNLVRRVDTDADEPRFAMLETIREYGLEGLSTSGEEPVIRRRHAEHWIRVAQHASDALPGADNAASTLGLEHDHDNFRSALSWSLRTGEAELGLRLGAALRDFWRLGSHFREGVRWLDDLLALPAAGEGTVARARALTAAADLSSWMGENDTYLRRAEEAVAIYRGLGDLDGVADALLEVGTALMSTGRFDEARATLEEARELNIGLGERQRAAECTVALGLLAGLAGRPDQARAPMEDALATFKDLGDPFWSAFTERLVGGVDRTEGNLDAAQKRFVASLAVARQYAVLVVVASDLYALADLALARGTPERALRLVGASEAIREQVGEAPQMEMALVGDVRGGATSLLDKTTAERLYAEGRNMGLDDAVAYALEHDGD